MSRAGEIRSTVTRLKERAENSSGKLRQIRELNENAERISTHLTVNDDNIEIVPLEDDGGLTDAEKMLLLMCQQEASAKKKENEDVVEPSEIEEKKGQEDQGGLTDAEKMLLLLCQQEAAARKTEVKEATGPIEEEARQVPEKQQASDVEHVSEKDNINCIPEIKTNTPELSSMHPENSDNGGQIELDHEESSRKSHQLNENNATRAEIAESLNIEDDLAHTLGPKAKTDTTDASEDFDLKEITKDINKAVVNIEARCVGVREELGQMAMSEQYLRTKQAQLLAKRKEKEANTALEMAAKKEQEAQDMRRKVANMMKLLEERKTKLKVTENVLDKRTNVVDKVNKLLEGKERRANFVQKQRDECVVFDVSHRSSKANKEKKQDETVEPEEEKATEQSKNVEEDK